MLGMNTVVPDIKVLRRFEEETSKYMKMHEKIVIESVELTKLRDDLLPILMNGQATVTG